MRSIGSSLDQIRKKKQRELTDKQRELAEQFYELVDEWKSGEIGLTDVENMMGGGYVIHRIILATPRRHPSYDDIKRFNDALWSKNRGPGILTRQGWITEAEIQAEGGKMMEAVDPHTGLVEFLPVFPTGFEKTLDGKPRRDHPIYGSPPQFPNHAPESLEPQRMQGYELWENKEDET